MIFNENMKHKKYMIYDENMKYMIFDKHMKYMILKENMKHHMDEIHVENSYYAKTVRLRAHLIYVILYQINASISLFICTTLRGLGGAPEVPPL